MTSKWQYGYPEEGGYYWIQRQTNGSANDITLAEVRWVGMKGHEHWLVIAKGTFMYREDIKAFYNELVVPPKLGEESND